VAAASALRTALALVGIRTIPHGYPSRFYLATVGSPDFVHRHDLGIDAGTWSADWPGGWGWFDQIADGSAIVPVGNANVSEINDPVVNSLLAQMQRTGSASAGDSYADQIDRRVMSDAVMLPAVYVKSLLYRNPALTNVSVQDFYGTYNYAVLGTR
jgi:peptide/nickel transport system substrate-binding protein